MALNRSLQKDILQKLASIYPAPIKDPLRNISGDRSEIIQNIHYLTAHNLLETTFSQTFGTTVADPEIIRITHQGMDFLADDGGLGAILNVVTVRLHEDTLRGIITAKITASDLSEEEKRPLLQAIRELPGEAIKHLSEKLLDAGLEKLPGVGALIYTSLQPFLGG